MRIIAGRFRGRPLKTLKGEQTRPTSGLVRGALFSILGDRVEGARILDLYAGSGAIALEALSRGAREAVLVERSSDALKTLEINVKALGAEGVVRVLRSEVLKALPKLDGPFDLIFADPPYHCGELSALLEGVLAHALLAPGGTIVLEHAKDEDVPEAVGPLARVKAHAYSGTMLSRFELRR